jgi:hypothetical protein
MNQAKGRLELESVLGKLAALRQNAPANDFLSNLRATGEIVEACRSNTLASAWKSGRPESEELVAFGRDFFARWEVALEDICSTPEGELSTAQRIARQKLMDSYCRVVDVELTLCRPGPSTRVCHIGCGPMPMTLFMWHYWTGCRIVGIDIVKEAVEKASLAFVQRLVAEPKCYDAARVSFREADGAAMSYEDFDVVALSSTVRGKGAILDRIAATAPKGVVVIERVPQGFWKQLASWEEHAHPAFTEAGHAEAGLLKLRRLELRRKS